MKRVLWWSLAWSALLPFWYLAHWLVLNSYIGFGEMLFVFIGCAYTAIFDLPEKRKALEGARRAIAEIRNTVNNIVAGVRV